MDAGEGEVVEGELLDEPVDEIVIDSGGDELARVTAERDEYLAHLQRTQAEFDNYRKRMLRDQTTHLERATAGLVEQLLPVLDSFELALGSGGTDVERLRKGVELVYAELLGVLEKAGLERMEAARQAVRSGRTRSSHACGGRWWGAGRTRCRAQRLPLQGPGHPPGNGEGGYANEMAPQREWFEKDYYAVLGLQKGATEKDITRAYRKLAKQHHPDANPGNKEAEEKFKDISTAYDVLGDAPKRKEYDEVRQMVASGAGNPFAGAGQGGFGGPGGGIRWETTGDVGDVGGLGDLLGNLFGRAGRRAGSAPRQPGAGPRRGGDLEAEVHLAFDDAVRGATIAVQLTGAAPCHTCGGTGAAPGTVPQPCPQCNGVGTLAVDQGPFSFSQICPAAAGADGWWRSPARRAAAAVSRPAPARSRSASRSGVADGQRVRVKGKGMTGSNGGPPGDLVCHRPCGAPPPVRPEGQRPAAAGPGHVLRGGPRRRGQGSDARRCRHRPGPAGHGRARRSVRGRGMPRAGAGVGDLLR